MINTFMIIKHCQDTPDRWNFLDPAMNFINCPSPGHVGQSVTCLTASLIPAWSHTFMEIDNEIISTAILFPSTDSKRVVVSYKRNYVYEVLVMQYLSNVKSLNADSLKAEQTTFSTKKNNFL